MYQAFFKNKTVPFWTWARNLISKSTDFRYLHVQFWTKKFDFWESCQYEKNRPDQLYEQVKFYGDWKRISERITSWVSWGKDEHATNVQWIYPQKILISVKLKKLKKLLENFFLWRDQDLFYKLKHTLGVNLYIGKKY